VTHWQLVEPLAAGRAALVRFRLETGRTHQIRVHAADHGWPLLGDPLYGKPPRELRATGERLGRQALHAAVLELVHPATGARLRFESPLPADLEATLAELRQPAAATRSST
jgi:23S rRNA pseudouridine1911/1915/1917 synthase